MKCSHNVKSMYSDRLDLNLIPPTTLCRFQDLKYTSLADKISSGCSDGLRYTSPCTVGPPNHWTLNQWTPNESECHLLDGTTAKELVHCRRQAKNRSPFLSSRARMARSLVSLTPGWRESHWGTGAENQCLAGYSKP